MKRCPHCYAYNEDNAVFCEYCGSNISGKSNYEIISEENNSGIKEKTINFAELSKKPWAWAILVLSLVIIALVLSFCLTGGFDENYKYKKFAKEAAKNLVYQNLKVPTSAIWNEVSYVENNDKGQYVVYVDVDSQNEFGVYIKTKLFVIVSDLDLKRKEYRFSTFAAYIECFGKYDESALNTLKMYNNY